MRSLALTVFLVILAVPFCRLSASPSAGAQKNDRAVAASMEQPGHIGRVVGAGILLGTDSTAGAEGFSRLGSTQVALVVWGRHTGTGAG